MSEGGVPIKASWRSFLSAALVGILAGLVGAGFHALLDSAPRGRALLIEALGPGWLVLMGLGALMLVAALWLVRRFPPETAGSGIQEVEAIPAGARTLRWWRAAARDRLPERLRRLKPRVRAIEVEERLAPGA